MGVGGSRGLTSGILGERDGRNERKQPTGQPPHGPPIAFGVMLELHGLAPIEAGPRLDKRHAGPDPAFPSTTARRRDSTDASLDHEDETDAIRNRGQCLADGLRSSPFGRPEREPKGHHPTHGRVLHAEGIEPGAPCPDRTGIDGPRSG
jgi:hypothetical protein